MHWNNHFPNANTPRHDPEVTRAAAARTLADMADYLRGIMRYQRSPALLRQPYLALWQHGSTVLRVISHPAPGKPALLLVPSLINRWWMMDIHPSRSFAQFLAAQGFGVAVMDWQEPGPAERDLNIDGYIQKRLLPAMEALHQTWQRPVSLVGYCMGGLMAMAASQLAPAASLDKLVLMATPWDFRTPESNPLSLDQGSIALLERIIEREGCLPAAMMQPIFYRNDIWRYARMFQALGRPPGLEDSAENAGVALAVQRWLHEAVALSAPAARQCLVRWFADNQPMRGEWRMVEQAITPQKVSLPTLMVCPVKDKLVPPAAGLPLLNALPQADVLRPRLGHVGLMSSRMAPEEAWKPVAEWMSA
jgi:poly(3-hydroxyalkanoate) synthetase